MKTIVVLLALACVIFGCGKKAAEENTLATDSLKLPMEFSYQGNFVIGSMKNAETVVSCNKRLGELNADIGEFLADSVTIHLADGATIDGPRDSVLTAMAGFINSLSAIKVEYTTAIPLENVNRKHEWVVQWTTETYTYKDGKVEKQELHEDYRLVGGKIREVYQFARKMDEPPAK